MTELDKVVLACLLHPLSDLAQRAWGDKVPPEIQEACQEAYKLGDYDQRKSLVERASRLAAGRSFLDQPASSRQNQTAEDQSHLPLVSIFSGLSLEEGTSDKPPSKVGWFCPTVLTEAPVYPKKVVPTEEITQHVLKPEHYHTVCKGLFDACGVCSV